MARTFFFGARTAASKIFSRNIFLSPSFNFNDEGKIIIPDYVRYGYDKETFKYITRHIKSNFYVKS